MGPMKNIRQIFKTNVSLMDHPEVQELIDYCVELEGNVVEKKIDDTYNKEEIYHQILKDIQGLLKWKKRFCLKIRT